jgi:thioester reductase-like protein
LDRLAEDAMASVAELPLPFSQLPAFDQWVGAEDGLATFQLAGHDPAGEDGGSVDPHREAMLDPGIVRPSDRSFAADRQDHIFLTGATGFVGAHLLDELLRKTSAEITCLVRGEDEAQGLRKIEHNQRKYGLELGPHAARIKVVIGDLTAPRLGFSERQFQQLAECTDVIYHNGADINLALDYPGLRAVNVRGTHEILRLGLTHRLKPTHVVSSYAVHASRDNKPGRWIREEDPLPSFESLANGYSKSKWVVEQMVANARELGLPVTLYRPGNITGHSISGASNTGDIMHTLVMAILQIAAVPDVELTVDLTPVDFVAGAIAELSRRADCLGGTFNLLNPQPLHVHQLATWLRQTDALIDIVTLSEWRDRLANLVDSIPGEVLGVMSDVLSPQASSGVERDVIPAAFQTRFDCARTTLALQGTGVVCHPVDDQLLGRYMEYLQNVGFLAVPMVTEASR